MLINRLKKYSKTHAIHATYATYATYATPDTINTLEVARVARVQVAPPSKTDLSASDELISNWWLIHFIDLEPLEVAIWPPCNHTTAIQSYPNAIAAIPIPSPITVEAIAYD